MDAVELPYPVDLAASKLMGSEGFGRAGVTVEDAETRDSGSVPIVVNRTERCCSLTSQKGDVVMSDGTSCTHSSESAMLGRIPDTELIRNSSKLPNFLDEHVSEQVHCRGSNYLPCTTRPEGVQLHQKSAKITRINSLCSTRQGITQLESTSLAGFDGVKDSPDRLESYPSKCSSSEKNQLVKQKNQLHRKRSEKRCPRVPAKSKYDFSPLKGGSASLSAASGGSNFLGLYGLKSDAPHVTNLLDDCSLIGLLNGTYEAPSLGKGKGKKETNMNETLLLSVRKAGSILENLRPIQPQKFAEIDCSSYKKLSTCVSPVSCDVREDTSITDPASDYKKQVSNSKYETHGGVVGFPLYQPRDVLECLALPPTKNLESLLLDAAKPTISSRNTPDPRSGKQATCCQVLPAFPWSYTFSGQSKTNADMIKLSSSRNACQGRWGRIGNTPGALGVATDCFSNLDSLRYDNELILSEYKIEPYISSGLPWFEWGSSSSVSHSKAHHVPLEAGGGMKYEGNAESCPRILTAAQTLMDMVALTVRQNKDGLATWQKKVSQKTSRARKSRASEKSQEIPKAPSPFLGFDNLSRSANQELPSKKLKLSMTEREKDPVANSVRKGSVNWSIPRSVRSSPNKSEGGPHSSTKVPKLSSMLPPPARLMDKAFEGEHKTRTSITEWPNRERKDSIPETRYMMHPPARASDKPCSSEQKCKTMNSEERPRNSAIANWHYEGRDSSAETRHSSPHNTKQSSLMPPPSRTVEKTHDGERKLKQVMVDWNLTGHSSSHTIKQTGMMPPPAKVGEIEQKHKACDGEERPRKSVVDKTMDWRNDWK